MSKSRDNTKPTRPDKTLVPKTRQAPRIPLALVASLVLLFAIVVAVDWPVLSAKALCFDDDQYLVENPLVQNPSWASVSRFLTEVTRPSTVYGYYQPLNMISLMVDASFRQGPADLQPFRRTSLLLHAANAVLIAFLLYRLFNHLPAAIAVGLVFGLHPMTVEPLAWLGEHKTLLATFFCLISTILYVGYAQTGSGLRFWLSVGVFLLALLSKPTSVPLPAILILLDFWPLGQISRKRVIEKWPFWALAAVFAVITVISQEHLEFSKLRNLTLWQQSLAACHNVSFYLWKAVVPVNLSPMHQFLNPLSLANNAVLAGFVATVLLLALAALSLVSTRALAVGLAIYLAALSPTLLNVTYSPGIGSEKYAYWPLFGLLLIVAWLLSRVPAAAPASRVRFAAIAIVILGLIVAEAYGTRRQLRVWQDTETLCRHMMRLAPKAVHPRYNLAMDLARGGRPAEAMDLYRECIELDAAATDARNNLGLLLVTQRQIEEAIRQYEAILQIRPRNAKALNNLGLALTRQRKFDDAIKRFEAAIAVVPMYAKAHCNLALALEGAGRIDQARDHYQQSLALNPHDAVTWNNLGSLLARNNNLDEAVKCFDRAVKIRPDYGDARSNLETARRLRSGTPPR